jgi:hypothetical protein
VLKLHYALHQHLCADYEPGAKEPDDVLWEPEWDDEGNDEEFLKIIREELQKNASKK